MLYEKHLVNFCLENNINLSDFYDKFLEEQITKNKNPEVHLMLLEMYAENWFGNLMGKAGQKIGQGVSAVKQGMQNFKTSYNQSQPDAALRAAIQAKDILTKAGLYEYFKDSFNKLKQEMMSKAQGSTTQNVAAGTSATGSGVQNVGASGGAAVQNVGASGGATAQNVGASGGAAVQNVTW